MSRFFMVHCVERMVVVMVVIAVAVSKVLDGSKRQYIFERRDDSP